MKIAIKLYCLKYGGRAMLKNFILKLMGMSYVRFNGTNLYFFDNISDEQRRMLTKLQEVEGDNYYSIVYGDRTPEEARYFLALQSGKNFSPEQKEQFYKMTRIL